MKQVIIIGGGVSGLVSAIVLARNHIDCLVIERKRYPLNRVCGEYVSNEALSFLKSIDAFPFEFDPPAISRFMLSSNTGNAEILPLEQGGFGISRFVFDDYLFRKAQSLGVEFWLDTEVTAVEFFGHSFKITTDKGLEAAGELVLGAHGKRSKLDAKLNRMFMSQRSPFIGVKYHVKAEYPRDLISLHNFPGGYCGISPIENNVVNVCYLSHRDNLKNWKNVDAMELQVLYSNPRLKKFLTTCTRLWDKPEIINEISFASKSSVENHMLMIGDSAGMITPLCGNGMAIAIHSAKIASELCIDFFKKNVGREELELKYSKEWKYHFAMRLWVGRNIQKLFGSTFASSFAIGMALHSKPLARFIIRNTHGNTF